MIHNEDFSNQFGEQPSPVSVLDSSFYHDDLPLSPVKKTIHAMEGTCGGGKKQNLECNSNDKANMCDLDDDPISKVLVSDKKKNYFRAISSTSSIKQVKMIQASNCRQE